jgi:chemotaxis signal transduction protein
VAELRNVIVFSISGSAHAAATRGAVRYALELRWVREVVSLGFITNVPTAPAAVSGVCNLHGTILPVLDVSALLGEPPGTPARQGDGALVIELEGVAVALRIDQVDHVASLHETGGAVVDSAGRPLTLLDPAKLIRRATELVTAAGAGEPVEHA